MKALIAFYQSSIGKKWVVALTGAILILFVIGHMLGNLQIFLGQDTLNAYAQKLQSLGELLWVARIGLLVTVILHIVTTVLLAIQNAMARPQKYEVKKRVAATLAARTMLVSGLIVLCFIIFHILHYTTMSFYPDWKEWHDAAGRHDVYRMMIVGFQNKWVSAFYILSVFLLCMHLSHGIQSFLQTLGIRTRGWAAGISKASVVLAWLIFLGYASIPTAVLLGILTYKP